MYHKNRGSARIVLAGGGLLGLLVVVVIMAHMGGKTADTSINTKRHVEKQVEDIQERLNEQGRTISKMTEGSFDVILQDAGEQRIAVIKAVRSLKQIGLADAEALIDSLPATVLTDLTQTEAQNAKNKLELAGATAQIDKRRD